MGLMRFFHNCYTAVQFNHLDKSRILEIQKQRFRRLLHYAVNNSGFYKELYRGIDMDKCHLSDLPVVTKSDMIENWDRFVTDRRLKHREIQNWRCAEKNNAKSYLGEFIPINTSGSSGEQTLIIYHRKAMEMVQASLFNRIQMS